MKINKLECKWNEKTCIDNNEIDYQQTWQDQGNSILKTKIYWCALRYTFDYLQQHGVILMGNKKRKIAIQLQIHRW